MKIIMMISLYPPKACLEQITDLTFNSITYHTAIKFCFCQNHMEAEQIKQRRNNMHKNEKKKDNSSFFEYAFEIIAWIQIVASPLIAGLIVGGIIYLSIGKTLGLII